MPTTCRRTRQREPVRVAGPESSPAAADGEEAVRRGKRAAAEPRHLLDSNKTLNAIALAAPQRWRELSDPLADGLFHCLLGVLSAESIKGLRNWRRESQFE